MNLIPSISLKLSPVEQLSSFVRNRHFVLLLVESGESIKLLGSVSEDIN